MKKPLLAKLLKEVFGQLAIVEPHSDVEDDCVAHRNALTLVSYLIEYAQGDADLYKIKWVYYKEKLTSKGRIAGELV